VQADATGHWCEKAGRIGVGSFAGRAPSDRPRRQPRGRPRKLE